MLADVYCTVLAAGIGVLLCIARRRERTAEFATKKQGKRGVAKINGKKGGAGRRWELDGDGQCRKTA